MQDGTAEATYSAVRTLLDDLVTSEQIPCASVLIRRGGKELFFHETGLMDVGSSTPVARNTIFRLFSMTKPVVAVATMILIDDGVLGLDDAISDFIPEFAELGVYVGREGEQVQTIPLARPITVKDILTHTAGFSYWFQAGNPVGALYGANPEINREAWRYNPDFGGLDGLARTLGGFPLVAQPGEKWHYSMSLEVAGILIQRVSGQKLDAFMKARIFDPLEMEDTAFWVEPAKAVRLASLYTPNPDGGLTLVEQGSESPLLRPIPGLAGGGGLLSTIDDYSRFAEMLRCGGELQGVRILSKDSARAIMTNHLEPAHLGELPELSSWGLGGAGDGMGFGLGGAVVLKAPSNGVPAFPGEYSWGGGTSTTFWVDPMNDVTVVFMTQRFPPGVGMPRDLLHTAVYEALGLAGTPS